VINLFLKIHSVVRNQGLFRSLIGTVSFVLSKYHKLQDQRFDRRFGVKTMQGDSTYFDSVRSNNIEFAVPYEPVQLHIFKEMMRHITVDYEKYTFIDLGSGKGRALLFAAQYPFKDIIGVEFSDELHKIAFSNIEGYLAKTGKPNNFHLHCIDVDQYNIPDSNIVLFLYNPFFGKVMNSVLSKISQFLNKKNKDLIIMYRNPQCSVLFENLDLLRVVKTNKSYSIYAANNKK